MSRGAACWRTRQICPWC